MTDSTARDTAEFAVQISTPQPMVATDGTPRGRSLRSCVVVAIASVACASAPAACSVYDGGAESAASDGGLCEDELLAGISDAQLADAVKAHELAESEVADVTAFWVFVLVAADQESLDPVFIEAELDKRVLEIARPYASLFPDPCDERRAGARNAVLDGELTCELDCSTAYDDLFKSTVRGLALEYLTRALRPLRNGPALQDLYNLFYELKSAADSARASGNDVGAALRAVLEGKDTETLLKAVAEAIAATGALATVAMILGSTAPVLGTVAAVGAAVGAFVLARELVVEFDRARAAERACRDWQAEHCETAEPECEDFLIAGGLPSCCWCTADSALRRAEFMDCFACKTSPVPPLAGDCGDVQQSIDAAVAQCCADFEGEPWTDDQPVTCG
jgi:hypothetical protein